VRVILKIEVVGEAVMVVVQEDENYYCKEQGHTKYNCPLLQEKQQQIRSAHVAMTKEEQSDSKVMLEKNI